MLGAIAGDVIGSRFEFNSHRSRDFDLFHEHLSVFTDDTVLTVAVAKWLLGDDSLTKTLVEAYRRYRNRLPHIYGHHSETYWDVAAYQSFADNLKSAGLMTL